MAISKIEGSSIESLLDRARASIRTVHVINSNLIISVISQPHVAIETWHIRPAYDGKLIQLLRSTRLIHKIIISLYSNIILLLRKCAGAASRN